MQRNAMIAICIWMALTFSLSLVSLTSYSYYSNNENYLGVIEDPEWMGTLPEGLSAEVSDEIADILLLSEEATQRVYDAILASTTDEWANDEGTDTVNDIIDYLTGRKDALDSSIDISDYKAPVVNAIITFLPSFLAETISGLLPDEIPLSALVNTEDLDHTRSIFSFMEKFRYVLLAMFMISFPLIYLIRPTRTEIVHLSYLGSILSLIFGLASLGFMTLRVKLAFDGIDLSFVKSFGSMVNEG
ncbi:MAG: hypothetical protein JW825_01010, partial [Candidatus Methanofastidiosa archaeon]|nr:hypothetical protein [Candidatus Methanofastidiosa archaeon]